jgi:O-antigen ligase
VLTEGRFLETNLMTINYSLSSELASQRATIWVFIASIFVPIEVYLFGAFLRPIFLGTMFVFLAGIFASLLLNKPFKVVLPPISFILSFILIGFFVTVQPMFVVNYGLQFKELIEVAVTLACAVIVITIVRRNGAVFLLQSLYRVGFLFVLAFLCHEVYVGDFPTFKDPYWIILMTSLSALSLIYLRVMKIGSINLSLLPIIFLSASRTLWACLLIFVIPAGSLGLRMLAGISFLFLGFLATMIPQIHYYIESLFFLIGNTGLILEQLEMGQRLGLANASDNVRLMEAWRSVIVFFENPVLGVGVNNYQNYLILNKGIETHITAHNELLRVLAEGGAVLFSIYSFLYLAAFFRIRRKLKNKPKNVALGFLGASFFLAFFTATNFTITLLLIISISFTYCPVFLSENSVKRRQPLVSDRIVLSQ